jgi:hypothetical protein
MMDNKQRRKTECSKYLGCVATNDARRVRVIKTRTCYDTLSLLPLEEMSIKALGPSGKFPVFCQEIRVTENGLNI